MVEEIGATRPGMANLTVKAMRRLFAYAIKKELRNDNPFVGIESYKLGTHHTWTDAEIAKYEAVWPIGTRERLAFDLLSTLDSASVTLQRCAALTCAKEPSTSGRKRPATNWRYRCTRI
jgi:hypothetical protein